MHLRLNALLSVGLLALSAPLWAAKRVDLDYQVRFLPATDEAERHRPQCDVVDDARLTTARDPAAIADDQIRGDMDVAIEESIAAGKCLTVSVKANLLNQSQDEQQQKQPEEVDGGQQYTQPTQVQGPAHVKWFNHNDDKYKCCCSSVHVKVRKKRRIRN